MARMFNYGWNNENSTWTPNPTPMKYNLVEKSFNDPYERAVELNKLLEMSNKLKEIVNPRTGAKVTVKENNKLEPANTVVTIDFKKKEVIDEHTTVSPT